MSLFHGIQGGCKVVSLFPSLALWVGELWHALLVVVERVGGGKEDRSLCLQPPHGWQTLPSVSRVRAWDVNHILWLF